MAFAVVDFRMSSRGVDMMSQGFVDLHLGNETDATVCENDSNSMAFWIGWGLFAAQIPFCYLPQYIKLLQAGTHIGLSLPNNICFALVGFLQMMTYICSKFDITFVCCNLDVYNGWQCGYAIAPFLQTVSAWIGSTLIVYLYFYVFDRPGLEAKNFNPDEEHSACMRQVWVTVFIHTVLTILPIAFGIAGGAVDAPLVLKYGQFCSTSCSVLIASHWFLQMHETWRMQGIGSLSIFMCVFSVFGSLMSAVTFSARGFWVALPFWVGSISISMATIFALYIEHRAKSGRKTEFDEGPAPLDPVSFVGRASSGRSVTGSVVVEEEVEESSLQPRNPPQP